MNIEKIYNDLENNLTKDTKILKNELMSKHTSLKIGGPADIFIKAQNENDVNKVLMYAKKDNIPLTVIGNGSNILVKDGGIRGIVLVIGIEDLKIKKQPNEKYIITVGAGVKNAYLARKLAIKGIAGYEFASGIPGTIGGAIRMNAGAHGFEIKDLVVETRCLDKQGNIKILSKEEQKFEYRNSIFQQNEYIILSTKLCMEKGIEKDIKRKIEEYSNWRKEHQPIEYPSAGSTFKRGKDFITAKLIDESGLKGYCVGDAKVSEKHAGFVINKGNAKAKDILILVEYIKKKVYEKFGKNIELEVQVIGED